MINNSLNFSKNDISRHNDLITQISYHVKISVSFIGFALSIWAAVFFHRSGRSSHFCFMLKHLSMVECVFCLSGVIFESSYFVYIVQNTTIDHRFQFFIVYLVFYITWLFYKGSLLSRNWILVLIAWRRYQAINKPLTSNQHMPKSLIQTVIVVIYVVSLIFVTPRLTEVRYYYHMKTQTIVLSSFLLKNPIYSTVYPPMFFIMISPVPVCIILFYSLFMLKSLKSPDTHQSECCLAIHNQCNQNMNRRLARNRSSSNKTVLILCVVFTTCEFPMCLAGILNIVAIELNDYGPMFSALLIHFAGIANILTSLDSVFNFIIYFTSFPFFKQSIVRALSMFKCWQMMLKPRRGVLMCSQQTTMLQIGDSIFTTD